MKNTLRSLAVLAAAALVAASGPTSASAATITVSATPTSGVHSGDKISVTVTGMDAGVGVYAILCKAPASQTAAPECATDQSQQAWITNDGSPGSSKDTGSLTALSTFTSKNGVKVDCLVDSCVIYTRGDHQGANSKDYSLIRVVTLSFVAGAPAAPVKKADVATALLNGIEIKANVPGNLTYREPVELVVRAASGLPVTLKSLTPDCAVDGTKVTALKGAGTCAIAATTAGNDTYSAFSAAVNFPFYLQLATQRLTSTVTLKKVVFPGKGSNIKASQLVSNMAEAVALTSTTPGICRIKTAAWGWTVVGLWPGTCDIVASAAGDASRYTSAATTLSVKVIRK